MAELTQQTSKANRIFGTEAGSKNSESEHLHDSAGVSPLCPHCGSNKHWRDALRYSAFGDKIQRWLCRDCGLRFSDPNDVKNAWSTREKADRTSSNVIKASDDLVITRQICVTETKNLAAEQQTTEVLRRSETDVKGKIIDYTWWMQKQGYSETTILGRSKLLKVLVKRGADLCDPDSVKTVIVRQSWCLGRKSNAVDAYTAFLKMTGGKWEKPIYKGVAKIPFVPTESEIDLLVASCSQRMGTFLQLLKETGMRPGEAWRLSWTDIDSVSKTVSVTPEKNSNPRILHISEKLAKMLESLPRAYGERVFSRPNMRLDNHCTNFRKQRISAAQKLKNSRLLRINFKTMRHFKGTFEYHKTKDILHVMQTLGHKSIKNTLIYTHLAEELFKGEQEYVSKVAKNEKDACALIDSGFDFVCDWNGHKIFRKRKY